MKSKIIKVSIILIFMLFSVCLFNFCFAYSITDVETIKLYVSNTQTATFQFGKGNDLPEVTATNMSEANIAGTVYSPEDMYNYYSNSSYFYYVAYNNLWLVFCRYGYYPFNCTGTESYFDIGVDYNNISIRYKWNATNNIWEYFDRSNGLTTTAVSEYIFCGGNAEFLYYATSSRDVISTYTFKDLSPKINMEINQTGTKTGHVTFTPENWIGDMYYIKDDMDELTRLIAEDVLSPSHDRVEYYSGPITIESGEYVMGMLFDETGTMIFSQISDTIEVDSDIMFDDTHCLRIDKSDLDTYYLFVHSPQEGDYIKVSSVPNTASDFNNEAVVINGAMSYNGLSIRDSFINGFNQLTREINITKNTVNYFYLYDVNNNLIDSAVLNTSNYYDGSDFKFDVELQYGSSSSRTNPVLAADDIGWCKVIPTYSVDNIDDLELYFRMVDYYEIYDGDSPLFVSKDDILSETIPYDTINKSTDWIRIDNQFNRYFYICTMINDNFAFFELELRTKDGQVLQNKGFSIYITPKAKNSYTGDMTVDGESVLDNVLSGVTSNNGNFDFSGLNKLSEDDLKTNLTGLIDNSIGFFGLVSTFLLLLPNWISSLLYLFFFGIIVITLLRFIRGA